ncbi:MAG: hypothetical protein WCY58_01705 [Mariniphaga sp.]|nr:hypothetical protein [Mariniphaga sp.]MDD4225573.1 hypothetical protein [Mariniphaga sp.]MDD4425437.1 hypothetical protein [Mariniphaga sp.]
MKSTCSIGCFFLFLGAVGWSFQVNGLDNYLPGARSLGLSHASVSLSDTWSTFHNQAGIAKIQTLTSGLFYESRFGIDELSWVAGSLITPVGAGAFGLSFFQFGKRSYNEKKLGLGYALRLAEKWNAGMQLDYFFLSFPENDFNKGIATFEGGVLFDPTQKMSLGLHLFNPLSIRCETLHRKAKLPLTIRIGGHYHFDPTVLGAIEVQKSLFQATRVKTGIEFQPAENLSLRVGVSGKPFMYTTGVGYQTGIFTTDIGFSYHGCLGIYPSVSIQINP